jgi:GNAT superfamily N-acetyltransferase
MADADTVVRPANVADVPGIHGVAQRGWQAAYSDILDAETIDTALGEWYDPAETREAIERGAVGYFVATRDGDVVGYVSGGPADDPGLARLGAIYVEPDRWGEGIGGALLDAFEEFCRDCDCERLEFRVLAGNTVGRSFYRGRGYEPVDERQTEIFGETVRELTFRGPLGQKSDSVA